VILPFVLGALALGPGSPDSPVLVPWYRAGNITLGEPRSRFLREHHRRDVVVTFWNGHVSSIDFSTPYYRTRGGFGVGSRIPIGNGHWHGFAWNLRLREKPCHCWTKVGLGKHSLPATGENFTKPWFFIDVRHGRVVRFYWDLRYID
jgi:hypothetical protein